MLDLIKKFMSKKAKKQDLHKHDKKPLEAWEKDIPGLLKKLQALPKLPDSSTDID